MDQFFIVTETIVTTVRKKYNLSGTDASDAEAKVRQGKAGSGLDLPGSSRSMYQTVTDAERQRAVDQAARGAAARTPPAPTAPPARRR